MNKQQQSYDVFLSHNSKDKEQVLIIAEYLLSQGLRIWIDKNNIAGGGNLPADIEEAIYYSRSAAFFIGKHGLGKWQKDELDLLKTQRIDEKLEIIPILLPGVLNLPDEPAYLSLKRLRWIAFSSNDFSSNEDRRSFNDLTQSIRNGLHKWTEKELERLLKEKEEAEQKLQEIEQEINQLEAQLKVGLSKEKQKALDWISSARARAEFYAKRALKTFPDLEALVIKKDDGLERFCLDLESCLEFVYHAFKIESYSFLDKMRIRLSLAEFDFYQESATLDVYYAVFKFVEDDISEKLDKAVREDLKSYFSYLKNQLSILV